MPSNNSKYTPEFREETARYIIESGRSATSMAEEIGIDKSTVCSWVREYRRKKGLPSNAEEKGIRQSMSPAGCPFDNASSESFFATVKKECLYLRKYATIDEVKKDIFEYLEMFYNRKRMHSYLGYLSPVEYRLAHSA